MSTKDEVVDLIHLNRYTGGDRALNEEILSLFESQCYEMLARLETYAWETGDTKSWREITHSLKGAARGIGAFALADAAADAEKTGAGDRQSQIAALQRIKDKSSSVHIFIEQFLKGEG
jgi:HPt (histidine-containing phosphotransfer) domain-containing protein